jgi:hypothetical protein
MQCQPISQPADQPTSSSPSPLIFRRSSFIFRRNVSHRPPSPLSPLPPPYHPSPTVASISPTAASISPVTRHPPSIVYRLSSIVYRLSGTCVSTLTSTSSIDDEGSAVPVSPWLGFGSRVVRESGMMRGRWAVGGAMMGSVL